MAENGMMQERARERLNGAFVGHASAKAPSPFQTDPNLDRVQFRQGTSQTGRGFNRRPALGNNFAHATAWLDWEQQTKTDAGHSAISSSASRLTSRNEEYRSWREPPETVKNRPPWNSMAFPDLSQRSLQTFHTCRHLKKRRSRGWKHSQSRERGLRRTRRTSIAGVAHQGPRETASSSPAPLPPKCSVQVEGRGGVEIHHRTRCVLGAECAISGHVCPRFAVAVEDVIRGPVI